MKNNNFGHDLLLLVLSSLFITCIFVSNNIDMYLIICGLSLVNVVCMRSIKLKYLIVFSLCMLPTTIGTFVAALLFAKTPNTSFVMSEILDIPLTLALRTFCIAWVSFIFIIHINFTNSILYAMQCLKLPIKIGYALLAMINAMTHIKQEFSRIHIAQKMRGISSLNPLHILYPLMISASKYAYVCGISLEARGLNPHKTFIHQTKKWHLLDSLILLLNILLILLMN